MKDYDRKHVRNEGSEVYLLKIYRRGRTHEGEFVGTLENVMEKKKKSFRTKRDLMKCLDEIKGI